MDQLSISAKQDDNTQIQLALDSGLGVSALAYEEVQKEWHGAQGSKSRYTELPVLEGTIAPCSCRRLSEELILALNNNAEVTVPYALAIPLLVPFFHQRSRFL